VAKVAAIPLDLSDAWTKPTLSRAFSMPANQPKNAGSQHTKAKPLEEIRFVMHTASSLESNLASGPMKDWIARLIETRGLTGMGHLRWSNTEDDVGTDYLL
jgi:hypothetical protein